MDTPKLGLKKKTTNESKYTGMFKIYIVLLRFFYDALFWNILPSPNQFKKKGIKLKRSFTYMHQALTNMVKRKLFGMLLK